jgi:PAS domain S-box-containing protein
MGSSDPKLIDSVFAGGGEMGARMRAFDWSTTPLGPVEQWPQSLQIAVRIILSSGFPMHVSWGPDYTFLYNDAWRPLQGARHPAFGLSCREVWSEIWNDIGPMYEKVMTRGQHAASLGDQRFLLSRNNYIEESYFVFSFSPIPNDMGYVGGLLGISLETTDRVLEDRRRQVLRDLVSQAAEARNEEEVWRLSAGTIGQNPSSIPFAFLYEYRPAERKAYIAAVSVEAEDALHPEVVDCDSESIWQFHNALAEDCFLVELGQRSSALPIPNWPLPPEKAAVVPIRLREHSEPAGFLVLGIHPGHAFDEAYQHFVRRIAEQIAIALASARAYDQERQRADALAELDRAKTTFFSNVSHEFRTPLTLMLGPLEEVQQEAREQLSPQHYGQLATAHRNALRLLKLVNTLLDFSRIEAGRLQAVYQPTDLASYTSQIASMFRSAMENAGLQFRVECQPIAEPVYVDRDMWEKIVLNLLSNAFKFTFEGQIVVTLKSLDGAVELQVRDTGVGIPEEHRERVFERFHRIEGIQARTYEGTGIGLALVQELVKLHGGSVRVESAVNVGSTFTVTIPRGKEHLPAERIQAAPSFASTEIRAEAYVEEAKQWLGDEPGAGAGVAIVGKQPSLASLPEPKPGEKRELIILADDNADMRRYLINMLGDRYEVHAVADGRQALEAARELRPALVLTDIMMPRLDGFGLLRAIRDDVALASTPVILLSARAGEEWRVQGLHSDADDYLVKPFTARELLARVAMHVRMTNLRRETAEREERLRGEAEFEREKLRASEERLAETSRLYSELQRADAELQIHVGLLQLLPVSAWTLKPDGTPDFVNQVWLEFAGQTLDFVRSHPEAWMTAVHPEDREMAARSFWEGVHSGQGFAFETRSLRAKDGTYRWHLQQAVVLRDEEGKVLKFVGTTTDIDDQKRAEENIRQSEKEARQLLDLSPLHISELGPDGARLYSNRATLNYYGISLEEWREADFRLLLHPQDAEMVRTDLPEKLRGGSPFEYEVRLRAKDGRYRWFQYRVSPALDKEGHTTRWYAAGTDIDDRKLAEQRLQEENVALREEIDKSSMFEEIVGTSAPLKKVLSRISKVAPTDSTVLITGETGTGKERVARAIHRWSKRSSHAFVSVNCAVTPRDLIASELLGHEKGAFTGATQRRLGRFELAEKGTIFLDEVGELPAETQIALLRVLQEREFERIGGTGTIRADVRVIAATNRDLESAIESGKFRSDLFYRLNVFPIEMPPLRERSEDIPLLVTYFLNRYARKAGRHFTAVDKKSLDRMKAYAWPGNIRELQNVIERSVIINETETFSVDESWLSWRPPPADLEIQSGAFKRSPAEEKAIIEAALRECGGRVYGPSGAAARLGMPRSTLESKIRALKINKNAFKGTDHPKNR